MLLPSQVLVVRFHRYGSMRTRRVSSSTCWAHTLVLLHGRPIVVNRTLPTQVGFRFHRSQRLRSKRVATAGLDVRKALGSQWPREGPLKRRIGGWVPAREGSRDDINGSKTCLAQDCTPAIRI